MKKHSLTGDMKKVMLILLAFIVLTFFTAPPASAQLVVWWNKSFVPQQDEALKEVVKGNPILRISRDAECDCDPNTIRVRCDGFCLQGNRGLHRHLADLFWPHLDHRSFRQRTL